MITATTENDRKLLEGIIAADRTSIIALYDLALPSVIQWVSENSGTEEDARDVFQDAVMALFRKLGEGEFELTCTLKSFIRIMCRNLWLARLRKEQRFVAKEPDDVEAIEFDHGTVHYLEQADKQRLFFKHFDALGESCRNILKWYFDKVPVKEIAARLETSESYVKKRKFKCKEQLVRAIQGDPVYPEL